ncbi:hypothetical protein Patl1_36329 [Pistacia atlantica]|nr:hypothetical protein Patl1_36329 [Pistacia atlantica]
MQPENGLPILKNVLLPKQKGFCACLEDLRGSLDAVYDVTIGYKHRCPTFLDNVFGVDPSEVHMNVRRIPIIDIPTSEEEVSAWLITTFQLKDKLLSNFYSQGHFPHEGTEAELSTVKFMFPLVCAYLASATYFDVRPMPVLNFVKAMFNH